MIIQFCSTCGSSDLVADRSLGGRIVCSSCGTPYNSKKKYLNTKPYQTLNLKRIVLFIVIILIIITILT